MNKPLLTIAIPTWNRGNILNQALPAVLSQIDNKELIEIIISDNASTDNTNDVIEKYILKYNTLNIIHNRQNENTGYFGNFKKCRELSNGTYFWLLSDNDFVAKGLISYIINILINKNPSFIFLRDWKHTDKIKNRFNYSSKIYSVQKGIEEFNYKTTLISAVIFRNNKRNDNVLLSYFEGNTFLGFSFFLESLNKNEESVEILGTSLYIKDTKVSFNAFKSFSVDLIACMQYAIDNNILSESTVQIFMNKVISELTVKHYILYRITGQLHGKKHKKVDVDDLINVGFKNYEAYKEKLQPLQRVKGFNFYKLVITKHLFKIIRKRLSR